ncbi:MAG: (4Fe-4S)-binding protein [Clostridiales Family XIII bacterium]|jgi:Fe-S-cluster-containing dehydrogenase component|nr:(4Fe-4S)-binding protein [Clostridiales Family XIII bacterium]
MKQNYIVMDVALCHDCNNCFIACKDEHVDNDWAPYTKAMPRHGHRWMNILRRERGSGGRIDAVFLPLLCQHCEDAPCVKAHPDCVSRDSRGVVYIDIHKAKDRSEIVESCPYGAIYWNEEESLPQKCTMCAHLLDEGWAMPRCVHSCPTGALRFYAVEPGEMARIVAEEGLSAYRGELGTKPRVYYKNLHRFVKNFIAGGALRDGDCFENAEVELSGNGADAVQRTDCFGEFKFDGLDDGAYTLRIDQRKTVSAHVSGASVNIGEISA